MCPLTDANIIAAGFEPRARHAAESRTDVPERGGDERAQAVCRRARTIGRRSARHLPSKYTRESPTRSSLARASQETKEHRRQPAEPLGPHPDRHRSSSCEVGFIVQVVTVEDTPVDAQFRRVRLLARWLHAERCAEHPLSFQPTERATEDRDARCPKIENLKGGRSVGFTSS